MMVSCKKITPPSLETEVSIPLIRERFSADIFLRSLQSNLLLPDSSGLYTQMNTNIPYLSSNAILIPQPIQLSFPLNQVVFDTLLREASVFPLSAFLPFPVDTPGTYFIPPLNFQLTRPIDFDDFDSVFFLSSKVIVNILNNTPIFFDSVIIRYRTPQGEDVFSHDYLNIPSNYNTSTVILRHSVRILEPLHLTLKLVKLSPESTYLEPCMYLSSTFLLDSTRITSGSLRVNRGRVTSLVEGGFSELLPLVIQSSSISFLQFSLSIINDINLPFHLTLNFLDMDLSPQTFYISPLSHGEELRGGSNLIFHNPSYPLRNSLRSRIQLSTSGNFGTFYGDDVLRFILNFSRFELSYFSGNFSQPVNFEIPIVSTPIFYSYQMLNLTPNIFNFSEASLEVTIHNPSTFHGRMNFFLIGNNITLGIRDTIITQINLEPGTNSCRIEGIGRLFSLFPDTIRITGNLGFWGRGATFVTANIPIWMEFNVPFSMTIDTGLLFRVEDVVKIIDPDIKRIMGRSKIEQGSLVLHVKNTFSMGFLLNLTVTSHYGTTLTIREINIRREREDTLYLQIPETKLKIIHEFPWRIHIELKNPSRHEYTLELRDYLQLSNWLKLKAIFKP